MSFISNGIFRILAPVAAKMALAKAGGDPASLTGMDRNELATLAKMGDGRTL